MELRDTTKLYGALADETRIRILFALSRSQLCVQDLTNILGIPQSTVSRHLNILGNVDLVERRRQKTRVFYSLAAPKGPVHQKIIECVNKIFPGFDIIKEDKKRILAYRGTE